MKFFDLSSVPTWSPNFGAGLLILSHSPKGSEMAPHFRAFWELCVTESSGSQFQVEMFQHNPRHREPSHSQVFYHIIMYCNVLYCTVLNCTALHCIALHCTTQHSTAQDPLDILTYFGYRIPQIIILTRTSAHYARLVLAPMEVW